MCDNFQTKLISIRFDQNFHKKKKFYALILPAKRSEYVEEEMENLTTEYFPTVVLILKLQNHFMKLKDR